MQAGCGSAANSAPGAGCPPWTKADLLPLGLVLAVVGTIYAWHLLVSPAEIAYHVDSNLYLAGAKSLGEGHGYRLVTDPASPRISFYPPLHSAYLALFWRAAPGYRENLPVLNLAMILLVLGFSAGCFLVWRRLGLPRWLAALAIVELALAPGVFSFAALFTSELLFACLGLATALVWLTPMTKSATAKWLLTGIGVGLMYLTRSAAVAVIIALLIILGRIRNAGDWRRVAAFLVPVLVAVAGWQLWRAGGQTGGYETHFYTYLRAPGGLGGYVHQVLGNAADYLAGGAWVTLQLPMMARLPYTKVVSALGLGSAATVVFWGLGLAFTGIACWGFWRTSNEFLRGLRWVLLSYLGLVLVWPYRLGPRLVFPAFPFLVLGFWEGATLASWRFGLRRALGWAWVLLLSANGMANLALLPKEKASFAQYCRLPELREAARWMQASLPLDAAVECDSEVPALDLHSLTGRRFAMSPAFPGADRATQPGRASQPRYRVWHLPPGGQPAASQEGLGPTGRLLFQSSAGAYQVRQLEP